MVSFKHIVVLALFALTLVFIGSAGYMIIEGWPLADALYMTIITMSTVGYHEVNGLSMTGRLFTMGLIVLGVGLFFYIAGVMVQFVVEGRIREVLGRRRLEKKIQKQKDHYIVCGYGRIGRVLCQHLARGGVDMVVVEKDDRFVRQLDEDGLLYVLGDATEEESLVLAGIDRAKGLVAALGTDSEDVYLVLTARQLKPSLYILARANQASSTKKLLAAGADKVISPHDIGAKRMADGILRPTVTDFLELTFGDPRHDIRMEEIPVAGSSRLAGVTLADSKLRQDLNLIVIAIKRPDASMIFNPSFNTSMNAGDTVIAVGQTENLERLEAILNPEESAV